MYKLSRLLRVKKPQLNCTNFIRPASVRLFASHDGFLQGNSANYIDAMYESWSKDPTSVHISWQAYFRNLANGVPSDQAFMPAPTDSARLPEMPGATLPVMNESSKQVIEHMKIQLLVRAYQVRGHNIADLDPLHIQRASVEHPTPPELTLQYYGFTEKDLDRKFTLGPGILSSLNKTEKELTLREIVDVLKKMYCEYLFSSAYMPIAINILKVVRLVSNTSTFQTAPNAIGFEQDLRSLSLTIIPWMKRNASWIV